MFDQSLEDFVMDQVTMWFEEGWRPSAVEFVDDGKNAIRKYASVQSLEGFGERVGMFSWIENSFGRCDGVKWVTDGVEEECQCGLCVSCQQSATYVKSRGI